MTTETNFERFRGSRTKKRERNDMKNKRTKRKYAADDIYIARGLIFVSSPFFIVASHGKLERTVELQKSDTFFGSFRMWASGMAPCCFYLMNQVSVFGHLLLLEVLTLSLVLVSYPIKAPYF